MFRLRSYPMIGVYATLLLAGWTGACQAKPADARKMVRLVFDVGGKVRLVGAPAGTYVSDVGDLPKGATYEVEELDVASTEIDDKHLLSILKLADVKHLKGLHLQDASKITDRALESLEKLETLVWFECDNTNLTSETLERLVKCKKLEYVSLKKCSAINNNSISTLVQMKTLKSLHITGSAIDEEGVKILKEKLPKCEIKSNDMR